MSTTIELYTEQDYGQPQPPAEERSFDLTETAELYLKHDVFPRLASAGLGAGGFVLIVKTNPDDFGVPMTLDEAREKEEDPSR